MPSRIWAPWRMEYILGDKGASCIFCDFPARNSHIQDLVLCVQPSAFVCLNRYPFAAGHLLVVPRKHVSALTDLDDDESAALFRLVRASTARLQEAIKPEGMNVGFNLGKAAGAGIAEHLHAHVVPRWLGDSNFIPVLADVRVMPEYLAETYAKLAPFFADLAA